MPDIVNARVFELFKRAVGVASVLTVLAAFQVPVLGQSEEFELRYLMERSRDCSRWQNVLNNTGYRKADGGQLEVTPEQAKLILQAHEEWMALGLPTHADDGSELSLADQNILLRNNLDTFDQARDKIRNEILLPHQTRILDQLAFRFEIERTGDLIAAITNPYRKNPAGLTEGQANEIRALRKVFTDKADVLEARITELQIELSKAQEEFRRESLAVLTPEQEAMVPELMGPGHVKKKFKPAPPKPET